MKTLRDLPCKGNCFLIRVDFNVPLERGNITDDTRIRASLPTLLYLLKKGGRIILITHLGRPLSKGDSSLSLKVCAERLAQLLPFPVFFAPDCIGEDVKRRAGALQPGEVLLLENLRFYPAEENPSLDPSFAQQLASLADFYIDDAFATAHRRHSSTTEVVRYFPGKAALGLLMEKEISFLKPLVTSPQHPFFVVVGGAKVSSKIGVLKALFSKVDAFFIGGGMAYSFLKAQGKEIGNSPADEKSVKEAELFLKMCAERGTPLYFPTDLVIASDFRSDSPSKIIPSSQGIPKGWQGMDIGPRTIEEWTQAFQAAATLFWNGPVGVFEFPPFARGTEALARAIGQLKGTTLVGGGDSVAAIHQLNVKGNFSHLSTGGGASLEYLEFGHLPGIDVLEG